ncbi:uncharacterized protein [Typha angustifolia]
MQHQLVQLREELKKAKEEKSQAQQELEEMKWTIFSNRSILENSTKSKTKVEILEDELKKARESEKKMLESLTTQTKQLEQTKISLEEAKLEIRSLHECIEISEATSNDTHNQDNIGLLKSELKLALEAEEKSKKAMDDLASALKEVTTESSSVKERIAMNQLELESMRVETDQLKTLLKQKDAKLRAISDERNRLRLEAEESFTAWREKESGFIKCMESSEDEINNVKQENFRLIDSQRAAREEISKLRDILKQAINEANVVKEALHIARNENSQLKDMVAEKDNDLKNIKQEFECLKVSEAAALDSVKELQSLLVATSSMDLSRTTIAIESESPRPPKPSVVDHGASEKMIKSTFDKESRNRYARRHSFGDSERFEGSIFDMIGSPEHKDEKQSLALASKNHAKTLIVDELDCSDQAWDSPTRQKKKRQILRKFGEILRRGSLLK